MCGWPGRSWPSRRGSAAAMKQGIAAAMPKARSQQGRPVQGWPEWSAGPGMPEETTTSALYTKPRRAQEKTCRFCKTSACVSAPIRGGRQRGSSLDATQPLSAASSCPRLPESQATPSSKRRRNAVGTLVTRPVYCALFRAMPPATGARHAHARSAIASRSPQRG